MVFVRALQQRRSRRVLRLVQMIECGFCPYQDGLCTAWGLGKPDQYVSECAGDIMNSDEIARGSACGGRDPNIESPPQKVFTRTERKTPKPRRVEYASNCNAISIERKVLEMVGTRRKTS